MVVHLLLCGMVGTAVAGVAYPAWTRFRARRKEREPARNEKGIRLDMLPFEYGKGPIGILMIHGFGSGPLVFRCMAPALAEAGFRVRAIRLPGFGEPMAAMKRVSAGDWRAAVQRAAKELRAGAESLWVVGHSMGGTLALDLAHRAPGIVDGLVLLAPLMAVSARRSLGLPPAWLFAIGRRVYRPDTILGTTFPVDLRARAEGIEEIRDRFLPLSMYEAMFSLLSEVRARPPRLPMPVMVIIPGRDKVVSRRAAREWFVSLEAPAKELMVDSSAGHVVPLDYGWAVVTARMTAFIRRYSPISAEDFPHPAGSVAPP